MTDALFYAALGVFIATASLCAGMVAEAALRAVVGAVRNRRRAR